MHPLTESARSTAGMQHTDDRLSALLRLGEGRVQCKCRGNQRRRGWPGDAVMSPYCTAGLPTCNVVQCHLATDFFLLDLQMLWECDLHDYTPQRPVVLQILFTWIISTFFS